MKVRVIAAVLAVHLLVLCQGLLASQFINNYIKSYDRQDYVWLDCNADFFETVSYHTENVTAFANLCRYLPSHVIKGQDLPEGKEFKDCNIFLKRRILREWDFLCLRFTENNGISLRNQQSLGTDFNLFWRQDDLGLDFDLEVKPALKGNDQTYKMEVVDSYPDTLSQDRRKVVKSKMVVTFNGDEKIAEYEGIYKDNIVFLIIRIVCYVAIGAVLLVPTHMTMGRTFDWHSWAMFWLAMNAITDVTLQVFGEKLPIANCITLIALPSIGATLLVKKKILTQLNAPQVSFYLLLVSFLVHVTLFDCFYIRNGVKNDKTFQALLWSVLVPLGTFLPILITTPKKLIEDVTTPCLVAYFLFLRFYELSEAQKGMFHRFFNEPFRGDFAITKLKTGIWIILAPLYVLGHILLVKKFTPPKGPSLIEPEENSNNKSDTKF